MRHYYKKDVAALLGIRYDTFKKNVQKGMYDHLIGPIATDERGWRAYSQEQVDKLVAWYNKADVKLRCIAMGGGVQSTAMLLMHFEREWDPPPDCAMFVDLGWESEKTYRNLTRLQKLSSEAGFPFYWIKARNIRSDLLAAANNRKHLIKSPPFFVRTVEGKKGQLSRNCTASYKIEVMRAELRRLLDMPARKWMRHRVEVWLGITTDEAHRLNNNSRIPWVINRFPLTERDLSREDCVAWLQQRHYEVPPKSACLGCPYRPDADWLEMKLRRPEEWNSVVEVDRAIRGGINLVREPLYLHSSLRPIEEVTLGNANRGLWGEECSGHCAT